MASLKLFPIWLFVVFQSFSCVRPFEPHEWQRARLPRSSLSPRVCWNSCPLSQMPSNHLTFWCSLLLLPSISPSNRVFSKILRFVSGGQSIGASASASFLQKNIYCWFPLGLTGLFSLLSNGTLRSLIQHHSSKASVLWCSAFFMAQLSQPYITTGKR